jgi:hypothetical protein
VAGLSWTFVLTAADGQVVPNAVDPSCNGPTIKPGAPCPGEETDPGAAINTPSIYAWTVFGQINQPAFPGNNIDTRRVWETWKSADNNSNPEEAIYLNNGHAPQKWNVQPRTIPPSKRLVPIQQLKFLREENPNLAAIQFITGDTEEVRVNRPAFNFILDNQLYNKQGQYQYASTHFNFNFPISSKEVKAIWRQAGAGDKVADYYSAKVDNKTYILLAMHVITKDLPFWFWASFVHKDENKDQWPSDPNNPQLPPVVYVAPLADYQVVPEPLKGTPFENYRSLAEVVYVHGIQYSSKNGGQIDWITRNGGATIMGNPQIEQGFETTSSCITCHARSSIALIKDGNGIIKYNTIFRGPQRVGDYGAVDPGVFTQGGVSYYPLDFLWSLRQAKDFKP